MAPITPVIWLCHSAFCAIAISHHVMGGTLARSTIELVMTPLYGFAPAGPQAIHTNHGSVSTIKQNCKTWQGQCANTHDGAIFELERTSARLPALLPDGRFF
jgi:hypothetical protein